MQLVRFLVLSLVTVLLLATQCLAGSYPGDGFPPNELPAGYGSDSYGLGPDMNSFGLEFFSPYPAPDSLTDQEKYIIAGASGSSMGHPLGSWQRDLFMLVSRIYFNTGEVPAVLTEDLIDSTISGEVEQGLIDRFRSPLTGEFPRLDADFFSPGDVYMRLLTPQEVEYAASLWEGAYDVLVRGVKVNPQTGNEVPVYILGGVWYMRVYGYNDVLYSSVDYRWTTTDLSQYQH
jgi:hypothetical protein